ncbi:MAG: hypothetical protein WBB67_11950 [bacterium]
MSKEWKLFASIAGLAIALYTIYFNILFPGWGIYYKILFLVLILFLSIIITLICFSWRVCNKNRISFLPKIEFRFISIINHPLTGKELYLFQALPKKSLRYLSPGLFFEILELKEKIEHPIGFLKVVHLQPSGLVQAVSTQTCASSKHITGRIKGRPVFWNMQQNILNRKDPYETWLYLSSWMQSYLDFQKNLREVNHA